MRILIEIIQKFKYKVIVLLDYIALMGLMLLQEYYNYF